MRYLPEGICLLRIFQIQVSRILGFGPNEKKLFHSFFSTPPPNLYPTLPSRFGTAKSGNDASLFNLPRNQKTLMTRKRIILAVFHLAKDGLSLITLRDYCPDLCRTVVQFWTAHYVVHFSCLFSHLPFCKNKFYFHRGVSFLSTQSYRP